MWKRCRGWKEGWDSFLGSERAARWLDYRTHRGDFRHCKGSEEKTMQRKQGCCGRPFLAPSSSTADLQRVRQNWPPGAQERLGFKGRGWDSEGKCRTRTGGLRGRAPSTAAGPQGRSHDNLTMASRRYILCRV